MNKSGLKQLLKYKNVKSLQRKWNFGTWSPLGTTFNSRPEKKVNVIKNSSGLFDVPELQTSEGFDILKEQCINQTDKLIAEATNKTRSRKMVEVFDELSNSLCKIADLSEFVRIAHPSPVYTKAAETASATASGIVEKLNTNYNLYSALLEVVKNGDKFSTSEVDDQVARLFLLDFEQSGIHLPANERQNVVKLNDAILRLGQLFVAASTTPRAVKKDIVPQNVRNLFNVQGENIIVSGLNTDSVNALVREIAYRVYFYPNSRVENILCDLLSKRNELAQVCGFPTYAERALKGSALENPTTVMKFLDHLSEGLKCRAEKDFQIMTRMKKAEDACDRPLAIWDTLHYMKKAEKEIFNVQNSECSPYFSLGACMEGLDNLMHRLFGINLVVTEMADGEKWSSDIYKLAVTHESEGLLGHIYCDFYHRSGKPNLDCHFTIRGGRALSDGSYQNPIVVLMLNFPLPRWSTPTLLSPGMVDNLFHEMGHAMHSMLARTRYQHVAGTRCSTDVAEVPSILMEYFASDIRVLRTFAKHFQTEEPMGEDMLQRLCASKRLFMASELQVQVFYSVLDQLYHGSHPLEGSPTDVLAKMQEKYYSLPYVKNTAWQLRFNHLVGYGAKYYSYLVSRALASCIWQTYFESDPLNRAQGEKYRHECLAHGGGKPPRQLVADYLGKEPSNSLLVESILKDVDDKSENLKIFLNN